MKVEKTPMRRDTGHFVSVIGKVMTRLSLVKKSLHKLHIVSVNPTV